MPKIFSLGVSYGSDQAGTFKKIKRPEHKDISIFQFKIKGSVPSLSLMTWSTVSGFIALLLNYCGTYMSVYKGKIAT